MKTLDEVIKAFEYCISDDTDIDGCSGCVYDKIEEGCHQRNLDALHYLKEYQKKQKTLKIREAEYKRGFEQLGVEWSRLKDNPPLTWDELRTMGGKPVWVKAGKFGSHWYLIEEICPNGTIVCLGKFHESITLYHEDILTYWQAYRKERE